MSEFRTLDQLAAYVAERARRIQLYRQGGAAPVTEVPQGMPSEMAMVALKVIVTAGEIGHHATFKRSVGVTAMMLRQCLHNEVQTDPQTHLFTRSNMFEPEELAAIGGEGPGAGDAFLSFANGVVDALFNGQTLKGTADRPLWLTYDNPAVGAEHVRVTVRLQSHRLYVELLE